MIIKGNINTGSNSVYSRREDAIVKRKMGKVESNFKKIKLMRSPSFKTDLSKINDIDVLAKRFERSAKTK